MAEKKKKPGGAKGGKKVRVEFRANRSRPARDRSFTRQFQAHGFAESDTDAGENVRGKGAQSRKRTVREIAAPEEAAALGWVQGRVVAMRGIAAEVDADGQVYLCAIRRVLRTRRIEERGAVTTGDIVCFLPDAKAAHRPRAREDADDVAGGEKAVEQMRREAAREHRPTGVIEWVAPRAGCLMRKYGRKKQTLVANVDQALIVSSAAEPYCKPHLIDRYLVSSHDGGITPVICFNKIDLDDGGIGEIEERYARIGYRTIRTSAASGEGIAELRELLRGRASVIVGQSGVGKSSLLNAVQPELGLRVARVSEQTEKGRHTTTTAQLLQLEGGGYVVDTPGVKSFELADVPRNELEANFPEIAARVPDCKFPNCTHMHEEPCAVKAAVEAGEIHPTRYESYVKMFMGE